ncbi:MAG: glycosyltransferase [Burkholderiales bacterium]|nr:glycosyltransferase [Burkholderiales bacterium]
MAPQFPPADRCIWIGLPAYNEEATIPALFPRFRELFPAKALPYRIVLYNDGCTDGTVAAALSWQHELNVEVIGCAQNMGLGQGLRSLVSHAARHGKPQDVLFILDCDDTHHPRQFPQMFAALEADHDVVIASRYRAGASIAGVALHRRILSLGAAVLFKLLHPCRGVLDYTCGYRGYRIEVLQKALAAYGDRLVCEPGFACMVELLLKLNRLGARMCEIPLALRYDLKRGASKMDVGGNTLRLLKKLVAWRIHGLGVYRTWPR